jgi:hypothetical protein
VSWNKSDDHVENERWSVLALINDLNLQVQVAGTCTEQRQSGCPAKIATTPGIQSTVVPI